MSLVTVKNKFQIVIPQSVRDQIGINVGDTLEAKALRGRIVFEPKAVVDRGIAESIAQFKAGRNYGPFDTHAQFLAALHKEARKPTARKSKKRPAR